MLTLLRSWTRRLRIDALALWLAARHPGTPLLPKALCLAAVAYVLSPFDLIPDFFPALGWLDDALALPVLLWLAARAVPADIMTACRARAQQWRTRPRRLLQAAAIAALAALAVWMCWQWLNQE